MPPVKYDFAGWVTKNDILCSDGVVIKQDAFKGNDGQKVPLVWNHNYDTPGNVLGHVVLHNQKEGIYGYGHFNDTAEALSANSLIKHGDISSMSIGARKFKQEGKNVTHGLIYEVSLVLAGANPGALIETVMQHSDNGDVETGSAIVYTGNLIHAADDIITHEEKGEDEMDDEKTIGDVMDTLSDEQRMAVEALIGNILEDTDDSDLEQSIEGDELMKHNVFAQKGNEELEVLTHSQTSEIFADAQKLGSLKGALMQHGINSIEMLFPEVGQSTNGNVPIIYRDPNTQFRKILDGITKSPFPNVRTTVADLTEDEARAKGYIKGAFKKEEFFSLIRRTTSPGTVYKKQKLDRDDILDIEDFDVVQFMQTEMRFMIEEELARAALVGDGREIDDEDKIKEDRIRPIVKDNEFFTIQKAYVDAETFLETVILAMAEYRGSGLPKMFVHPTLLAQVKLLKGTDGRWLSGSIPSDAELATQMGVSEIVPTTFLEEGQAVIVNLSDYTFGSAKGGQLTTFDDFDIDYNQYKYLIETRLSGSLTMPKSAINFKVTADTGATREFAGMRYGDRQADKPVPEPAE